MTVANSINQLERPTTKYIRWRSEKKCFEYYDKEAKKNVNISLPVRFIAIHKLSTITGWDNDSECGIYSNEVENTTTQKLFVKTFGNDRVRGKTIAEGFYKDIKESVKSAGAGYAISLYALLDGELVNFQFSGGARSSFIEAGDSSVYTVSKTEEKKNGSIKFNSPVFEKEEISDSEKDDAVRVYNEKLVPYFQKYFEKTQGVKKEEIKETLVDPVFGETPDEDLPF